MEQFDLKSWNDFAAKVKEIQDKYATTVQTMSDGSEYHRSNDVLFRGQGNQNWELEITLERRSKRRMYVEQYILAVNRYVNELESFTGKRWNLKKYPELRDEIQTQQDESRVHLPCYD